jgi:threonine aldolase
VNEHPRGFASDNFSGVHPDVLTALADANHGHTPAYGDDPWTARARARFRHHFGDATEAYPVFNGTAANVLALDALTRPYEAVICAATAHLNMDECGAPERIAGVKLLTVETEHGKLTPDLIAPLDARRGDQHASQPRAVSISQATELGTVYTLDEVRALADFAHERDMLLHVDGARLSNAAAALDAPLRALTTDAGVDALSFGGTKNGLVLGDAVVFLRPALADRFEFVRKQGMQLASKMRFLSVQFETLLGDDDLWLRNASHANAMARRLRDATQPIDGVEIAHPVEANAVFARLPAPAIERLRSELPGEPPFYVWDEDTGECRWMCSWDTTPQDVDDFAAAVRSVIAGSLPSRAQP